MEISKEHRDVAAGTVTDEELARINTFAKTALKADEVYAFAVKLCDNEVDRDFERFPRKTLEELAELFVGKSGIFDHNWSAQAQTARIYRTELVEEERMTTAGDRYCYVKGYAYMLRNEKNEALIEEIEGGIKKEVSVGCSIKKSICSVCGREIALCEHERGQRYGDTLCYAELVDAADAYEWSFVAVPAQRQAGVIKRFGQGENGTLRELIKRHGTQAQAREIEQLEHLSALGKSYLRELRREVVRLMLTAEESLDGALVQTMADKLDEPELRELKKVYEAKAAKKLGLLPQLKAAQRSAQSEDESDFRV